jgi:hypothetical protein
MPKSRKHHNNDGRKQIREFKTEKQIRRIAKKLGIPYGDTPKSKEPKQ